MIVQITSEPTIAIGRSRFGFLRLLGAGRDRVEADVGEEDHRRGADDAVDALGRERLQVVGVERRDEGDDDEERQDQQLDADHDEVRPRRLAHAADEQEHDRERRSRPPAG